MENVALQDAALNVQQYASTASAPKSTAVTGSRNHHLDNAKFVLMTTILMTHFVDLELAWPWYKYVKTFLSTSVVGFALISGYFAARSPQAFRSIPISVVAPLLFWFAVINPIIDPILSGDPNAPLPSSFSQYLIVCLRNLGGQIPSSWYLYSILWWGLWNRMIATWPPIAKLAFAVALSQVGGAIPDVCKISVAMMYFPMFITGTLLPLEEAVKAMHGQTSARVIALLVLVGLFHIEFCLIDWFDELPKWPWGDWIVPRTFQQARFNFEFLFFASWSTIKAILIICACPWEECWFSELGKYSIYPYILHSPLLHREHLIRHYLLPSVGKNPIGITLWLLYIYAVVFCILATALLSAAPVRSVFGCMIQPASWLSPRLSPTSARKSERGISEATDV